MWPEVLEWVLWGIFCPFIIQIAKTYPKATSGWLSKVKFHVPISIIIALLYAVVYAYLKYVIDLVLHEETLSTFSENFMFRLYYLSIPLMVYYSIIGLTYAITYYQQFRDETLKTAEIQQKLAQAELLALKKQLQPHFLFNTLNAISALMHKNIEAADKMIASLSNLLRATLENTGVQKVTLRQEMEMLKTYLDIEEIRFQDRLQVSFQIDPEVYDHKVPNLILQPIVENAIRHGVAKFNKQGKIEIAAHRVNNHIELKVSDNGTGIPEMLETDIKEGIGLKNTRMRLQQLYGEQGKLILNNIGQHEGLEVKILIPI